MAEAQEKAREVAGQAQEKAGHAADQAKSKVREQVDQRSTEVGRRVTSSVSDARSVADELRKQGKDGPARITEQAADRAERVGNWLTESDGDRILSDAEDFGRSNPWAVAVGGLAIGFAASRLLKASSSRRYRSSLDSGPSAELGRGTPPSRQIGDPASGQIPEPATRMPAGVGASPADPPNGVGGL